MTVSSQYSFVSSSLIVSAEVNDNFNRIYLDTPGNLGLKKYDAQHNRDGTHGSITGTSLALSSGLIVTAGGIIITAGGLTVSAGDITFASGSDLIITSGNLIFSVTSNITGLDINVSANVNVTGNVLVTGTMDVTGSITVTGNINISGTTTLSSSPYLPATGVTTASAAHGQFALTGQISYTVSTSTLVQVPNSTFNISGFSGRPIKIELIPFDNSATAEVVVYNGVTQLSWNITRDGTVICTGSLGFALAANRFYSPSVIQTIDVSGATSGLYVLNVAGAGASVGILNCRLIAWEL